MPELGLGPAAASPPPVLDAFDVPVVPGGVGGGGAACAGGACAFDPLRPPPVSCIARGGGGAACAGDACAFESRRPPLLGLLSAASAMAVSKSSSHSELTSFRQLRSLAGRFTIGSGGSGENDPSSSFMTHLSYCSVKRLKPKQT